MTPDPDEGHQKSRCYETKYAEATIAHGATARFGKTAKEQKA